MVELTASAHGAMVAHAVAGLPDEACGLFGGPVGADSDGLVDRFYPMTNAAASSQIYELDGREMLAVEKAADDAGVLIRGVMHSHTHTSPYPSPTDVADAARFDPFGAWLFVIVSLKFPEPALRAYRIVDGDISEIPVTIVDG